MNKLLRYAKLTVLLGIALSLLYTTASNGPTSRGGITATVDRKPVPDLTIRNLDGKPWRLVDHRGEVVLLNFWGSWCPPCREETPGLIRLANSHRSQGLSVVGISMDEGRPDAVRDFVSQFRIPYTIATAEGDSPLLASIQALPTTLLIDRQGRLAKTYLGAESENTFRMDVDTLLHEPEVTR